MDPLSEALRGLSMSGSLIAGAELKAPWGLRLDRFGAAVFHVMLSGTAWLSAGTQRPRKLSAGDIAVLMRGQPHTLVSGAGVEPTGFSELMAHCVPGRFPSIGIDGGGSESRMLCGFFKFDRQTGHPLLRALPDVVHVNTGGSTRLLEGLVTIADAEAANPRPGSGALIDMLCGVLLIDTLRAQLALDPRAAAPWISGIRDARVGKALERIHEDPARDWSVAVLASTVAMSRSNFAGRFLESVGEPPMRYVARCRVLRAAQMLDAEHLSVSEAMHRVGYRSESSFSRAFQRWMGSTPGAYRGGEA